MKVFFSESIKRNNKSTVWCVHISSWTITFFGNSIYIWFAKCLNKAKKYIRIIWSLSLGSFGLYTNNGIGNDKLDRTKVQNHFFFSYLKVTKGTHLFHPYPTHSFCNIMYTKKWHLLCCIINHLFLLILCVYNTCVLSQFLYL